MKHTLELLVEAMDAFSNGGWGMRLDWLDEQFAGPFLNLNCELA